MPLKTAEWLCNSQETQKTVLFWQRSMARKGGADENLDY